jgi:hypothetical protein
VADISGPEISVPAIDVTNHDSPGAFQEYLGGLASAGAVSFDLFFDPNDTGHDRLMQAVNDELPLTFALILPSANGPANTLGTPSGTTGGWVYASGNISYSSADPGATEVITIPFTDQVYNETYTLTVVFSGTAPATTGSLTVKVAGVTIGTLNPKIAGAQTLAYDATVNAGNLNIEVPSAIAGSYAFAFASIACSGLFSNSADRFDFSGIVQKVGLLMPVGEALKAAVSIQVSGKPVLT